MRDYDLMPAGLELERLVATEAMGLPVQWFDRLYGTDGCVEGWSQREAPSKEACKHTPVEYWSGLLEADEWRPSRNWEDMADVFEHFTKLGYHFSLQVFPKLLSCTISSDKEQLVKALLHEPESAYEQLPLLVCRAVMQLPRPAGT